MGIKERRTKIFLGLLLLSDTALQYIKLDERVLKLLELTLNQKTRSTLNSLIKDGYIEKESGGDYPNYRLLEKGFQTLCLEFPYFRFMRQSWDGKWRVLSYEIPEKKRELRDKLRRAVAGWGLGPWHRSFWLTPHPVTENLKVMISGREDEEYIQAFEAAHVVGDRNILIEKVWGKSALDKRYRELFKKWHETLSKDEDKTQKFKSVIKDYIQIIRVDPGLPKELMGDDWIGFEALNIFSEIRSILLS